jgi:hypothetical protein
MGDFMVSSRSGASVRALISLLAAPALAIGSLAVATPAQAQVIRPSFWGMHASDWTSSPTVPVGSANFTTAGTYWPDVETRRGRYDWTRLDQQVAAAEGVGARPMILLGQTPRFHSTRPGSADYADYMPDVKAWRTYVAKVAQRYGARLDYQIWPEPNIEQNWKGSPRQMAKLTVVAATAIQAAAGKQAKVVSPAVALRLPDQRTWTVNYFKQSIGGTRVDRYLDAIAIDPFPEQKGTPEDSFSIMRSIRRQLARIGVRKPFWNNEINYGVAGGGATTRTIYSGDKQQSYVIRTYVLSAAARMQRTYWLGWFRSPELAVNMADSKGRALPPGRSYEAVRSWLNTTNLRGCAKKSSGLWVCTATKGRSEVRRIYWNPSGRTAITTPRSTLRVENQEGGVSRRAGSRSIFVDYRPIMVASRR